MADLHDGLDVGGSAPETGGAGAERVAGLFRARYPEMVRLADLLGADDPEDIAQEAFARLIRKHGSLRDPDAAVAYVRASVVNLTRNRHRHLRVVRRDASGAVVAGLPAVAPPHAQVPEPDTGGIAVFTIPNAPGSGSYTMNAYLLRGYVGFWLRPSPGFNGYLAPQLAAGPPALSGLTQVFAAGRGKFTPEAFGYAHADVDRVVLHLPGGRSVSTSTFAAWPGSGLRLWAIRLPADVYVPGEQMPIITVTGFNAAGLAVARVTLGSGI